MDTENFNLFLGKGVHCKKLYPQKFPLQITSDLFQRKVSNITLNDINVLAIEILETILTIHLYVVRVNACNLKVPLVHINFLVGSGMTNS
jgi:hypothetical protein